MKRLPILEAIFQYAIEAVHDDKVILIKGGSLESAVVIRGEEIMSKEPMRFDNEFARHKALDILGDTEPARQALALAVENGYPSVLAEADPQFQ